MLPTVEQAIDRVLERCRPVPARSTPLIDALGLILAEPIVADIDLPPFDKALMDGYAVRSVDLSGSTERRFQISEEITAGRVPTRPIHEGEAARIMTGAPRPEGADAGAMVALVKSPYRGAPSRIIDTTATTIHELREIVTAWVKGAATGEQMVLSIVSFGYKYGIPVGLDLMLDVRFIPNPFFVPELRPLTGLDRQVHDYVMSQPDSIHFIEEVGRLLEMLIPLYRREGKSYLTIGLGCTGGRHRSPVLARALRERLSASGFDAEVRDHDIAR